MCISSAAVSCAVLVTLLAGCSNVSQATNTLPTSNLPQQRDGSISTAAGAAFKDLLKYAGHDASKVRVWVANNQSSYLFGLDESGTKIVDTINVGSRGCIFPNSIKVDSAENIWIDCASTYVPPGAQFGTTGSEQEYSRNGTLRRTYKFTASCPSSQARCLAYSLDGGPDNSGHVFADLSFSEYTLGNSAGALDTGFYWWSVGDPSARPKFIDLGASCEPICQVRFMDVDRSGNIWFTYSGGSGTEDGDGLAEVTNPTTNPRLAIVYSPGQYSNATGVFRSDGGKTLNVVDAGTLQIHQYALPVTSTAKPFNTLGPTPAGLSQGGYTYASPMTGGFNKAGTELAIGDAGGWLDLGKVASNNWKAILKSKFLFQDFAASYTPSDR